MATKKSRKTKATKISDDRMKNLRAIDKRRFAKHFAEVNASVAVTVDFSKDLVHIGVTTGAGVDKHVTLTSPKMDDVLNALVTLTADAHEDVKSRFDNPGAGVFIKALSVDSVRTELRRQVHSSSKARNLAARMLEDFVSEKAAAKARLDAIAKEAAELEALVA